MPSHTPFIITESDYRHYPTKFAPYVNLARQVILENDILMVGFSGDDPNFTAWTGWVRAEMTPYARTLFLAGLLDLDGQARDHLRERGIVPIDLGSLVPNRGGDRDRRSALAISLLLDALELEKPPSPLDWPGHEPWPQTFVPPADPTDHSQLSISLGDPAFAARYVEQCAGRWRHERHAYPGWIEPPPRINDNVKLGLLDHLQALQNGMAQASIDNPAQVLADVLWRLDLIHGTLADHQLKWLDETVRGFEQASLSQTDRLVMVRMLIREYRDREDRTGFDRWTDWLSQDGGDDQETTATVAYEKALWWRDRLAYDALRPLIDSVRGTDPVWHLRRAALWGEIGGSDEVRTAVRDAWRQLTSNATRTRRSIWMRSRLAWTAWIANALTRWSAEKYRVPEFVAAGLDREDASTGYDDTCDPWDVMHRLDNDIAVAEKERVEDQKSTTSEFDAGVTRGPGRIWRAPPIATVERRISRFADRVGIPPRADSYVNFTTTRIAQATSVSAGYDNLGMMRCLLAASRDADKLIAARFNRVEIARLDAAVVDELAARTEAAIDAALAQVRLTAGERRRAQSVLPSISALLELLSRFVVRLSPTQVAAVLNRALARARDPAWTLPLLFEPIGTLVRRAYDAVPPRERDRFGLALLNFPLPSEKGADHPTSRWPDPFSTVDEVVVQEGPDLASAVTRLITVAGSDHPVDSIVAVQRLTRLSTLSALTAAEREAFGSLVWSRRAGGGLGAWHEAGISAIYESSSPDPAERAAVIRSAVTANLVGQGGVASRAGLWMLRRLGASGGAALRSLLSSEEIAQSADTLLAWRAPLRDEPEVSLFDLGSGFNDYLNRETACALAYSLLPALSTSDIDADHTTRWASLATDLPSAYHLIALPHMARLGPSSVQVVSDIIQRSLLNRDQTVSVWALLAVEVWLDTGEVLPLPPAMVREVLGLVAARTDRAMPNALDVARRLVDAELVPAEEVQRLLYGLDQLASETDYSNWSGDDASASKLGLVRAAAVRLAGALVRHGLDDGSAARWIEAGEHDPMPEVRHAAIEIVLKASAD